MPPRIQFGQIVWADIPDDNGVVKARPAVVVTPNDVLAASDLLDVVAVTSRVPEPLPEDHILLPWHAQRHPRTGLNRKCTAVCSWVVQISVHDIQSVVGIVSGTVFTDILRKIHPRPPKSDDPPPTDE
jgi:mRNA-degrading endonuclease toxin of MazEF toxin-antitoxin module